VDNSCRSHEAGQGAHGPLSDAALAVLAKTDALRLVGADVVFPGMAGNPMSDMTLLKVLRDMSEPFHVHGFRSAFTDWAANEGVADAVVEAALAHKTPDAVEAAYRRTTYLGTPGQPGARVKLMDAWGRYCIGGTAVRAKPRRRADQLAHGVWPTARRTDFLSGMPLSCGELR